LRVRRVRPARSCAMGGEDVDTKAKLKHASSPETQGSSRWIQEVVLGVRAGAGATQGVPGHVHTLGNRTRPSTADGGARVPGVLTATKLEGLVAGVITPAARLPNKAHQQSPPNCANQWTVRRCARM
jgi:hypothetical protein